MNTFLDEIIQSIFQDDPKISVQVRSFYEGRTFNPYWLNKPKAMSELIEVLENSSSQGLPTERYGLSKIFELKASEPPLKIEQLPDLRHRAATSAVTFGLLS